MLEMSDSTVSDYRRKMEQEMQKLLKEYLLPEQMSPFAEELSAQLKRRVARIEAPRRAASLGRQELSAWPRFNYSSLATLEALPVV
jgi:ATP-dependent Lon protease